MYTRAGNLLFSPRGSFYLDENGEEIPVTEMRFQRVKINYVCPLKDCDGDVSDFDGTGEMLSCDICNFSMSLLKRETCAR